MPTPRPNSAGIAPGAGSRAPSIRLPSNATNTRCTRQAEQHAEHAGHQPDTTELQRIRPGDRALRRAQHAQHRAIVEPALREVARGDRHRHRGQQSRQQRHQVEELLGAVERLAHLGPARRERLDAQAAHLVGLLPLLGPAHELGHLGVAARAVVTGDGEAIDDPAARLNEAGAFEIGHRDHHARREVDEAGAAVGLQHDHALDDELCVAEQQRIADRDLQGAKHGGVNPGAARRRRGGERLLGAVDAAQRQPSAQRIGLADRLHRDQARAAATRLGGARHARKTRLRGGAQLQRRGMLGKAGRCR